MADQPIDPADLNDQIADAQSKLEALRARKAATPPKPLTKDEAGEKLLRGIVARLGAPLELEQYLAVLYPPPAPAEKKAA